LASLGTFCSRHAILVILLWISATVAAGTVAERLPERLLSGAGEIAGSLSSHVDRVLREDFGRGDSQSLIVVFQSRSLDGNPAQLAQLFDDLSEQLQKDPSVNTSVTEGDIQDERLLPRPGTGHFVLIDLKTEDVLEAEQQLPNLRKAATPVFDAAKAQHRDLDWAITGRAALTYDLSRFDAQDTARAEFRALPLTLLILLFAFGSIVSAMLPLVLAVATRTMALGMVFWIAASVDISNLVLSVVTMLSIASRHRLQPLHHPPVSPRARADRRINSFHGGAGSGGTGVAPRHVAVGSSCPLQRRDGRHRDRIPARDAVDADALDRDGRSLRGACLPRHVTDLGPGLSRLASHQDPGMAPHSLASRTSRTIAQTLDPLGRRH
jgi:predicted RND superfamily exporter protein